MEGDATLSSVQLVLSPGTVACPDALSGFEGLLIEAGKGRDWERHPLTRTAAAMALAALGLRLADQVFDNKQRSGMTLKLMSKAQCIAVSAGVGSDAHEQALKDRKEDYANNVDGIRDGVLAAVAKRARTRSCTTTN